MPTLHPTTGEWCAGVGSVGVSREKRLGLIAEHAGSACWLEDRVLYQREANGRAFLEADGTEIDPQGANRLFAGGGVWAAWLAGVGYRDSFGRSNPAWGLAGVGPDGTIAITARDTGRGLLLISPVGHGGATPDAAPDDQLVQVLGFARAIWTEQGHTEIRSVGFDGTSLAFLTHVGFWLKAVQINNVWWLLYQDEHDRLLFHRADATAGKIIAQGNTFRPDVNSAGRVVYAVNEGELPSDIRTVNALELPDVDLRPGVNPPPPVQPPSQPPVEPPKEPTTVDVRDTLAAVRATYPTDRGLTREERGALLNAVAWAHRADGVGLQRKDGGDNVPQPRTGILIAQDILRFPGNVGRDVLQDAEGAANPAWGDPGPADPATFVAPVEPVGASQPPPVDPPPVTPPPADPTLVQRIESLERERAVIRAAVDNLTVRVAALEKSPMPPPSQPPTEPPPSAPASEATLRAILDLLTKVAGKLPL